MVNTIYVNINVISKYISNMNILNINIKLIIELFKNRMVFLCPESLNYLFSKHITDLLGKMELLIVTIFI